MKSKALIGVLAFVAGLATGGVAMHVKMKMDERRSEPPQAPSSGGGGAA